MPGPITSLFSPARSAGPSGRWPPIGSLARRRHWVSADREGQPRLPFLSWGVDPAEQLDIPPLLRAYLRLGAQICGRPAFDPAFNTADFLLLDTHPADQRYLQQFRQFGTRA